MTHKFAYAINFELYFTTISLLIMISLIDIVYLAAEPTTRECGDTNPLCEDCSVTNISLCRVCKNVTMCSELENRYVTCLPKCPNGYFYKVTREKRFCCEKCFDGCLDGCTGTLPYIGKRGCTRCKYALFEEGGRIRCLSFTGTRQICLIGYDIKNSTQKSITEYECKKHILHSITSISIVENTHETMSTLSDQDLVATSTSATILGLKQENFWIIIFISIGVGCLIIFASMILVLAIVIRRQKRRRRKKNHNSLSATMDENNRLMRPSHLDIEMFPIARMDSPRYETPITQQTSLGTPYGNVFFPSGSTSPGYNTLTIITKDHIELVKQISEGQFGIVYLARYNNQEVAAKKSKNQNSDAIKEAIDESTFMAKHYHPHIQKLLGICHYDGYIMIVSELRLGNLKTYLRANHPKLTIRNLLLYCTQIAMAVEFLHDLNKIHADLAARNVLVKSLTHVEVGDFGLSKALKRNETGYKNHGFAAGRWLSPESLRTWVFDKPNDVWAFGVTCWEIFTLGFKLPYDDQRLESREDKATHIERLENGYKLPQPQEVDCLDAYGVMLRCWAYPAESRASISEIREDLENLLNDLSPVLYTTLGPVHR